MEMIKIKRGTVTRERVLNLGLKDMRCGKVVYLKSWPTLLVKVS